MAQARNLPAENAPRPTPDDVENRRRAALRLTPLVLERMQEASWVVDEYWPGTATRMAPGLDVVIPSHWVMHRNEPSPEQDAETEQPEPPQFDVLLRVPGPGRRSLLSSRGAAHVFYDDIAAVASAQQSPRELIVAVYDADSGTVSLHRIPEHSLDEMKEAWLASMTALRDDAMYVPEPESESESGDQLPEPEHEYNAAACHDCVYRGSCPAQQPPRESAEPELDEDAFAESLEQWLYADEKIRELRQFEKIRDRHRDDMVKMLTENKLTELYVHDNTGQLRLAKVVTQKRNSPNYKGLQEALPPSIYNELVPQSVSNRFTVSKPK